MLVADSEVILAIDTSFPAVDLGPIVIHNVPAASDASCGQEKTAEEAFKIKSQNLEVSLATTWPLLAVVKRTAWPGPHASSKSANERRELVE